MMIQDFSLTTHRHSRMLSAGIQFFQSFLHLRLREGDNAGHFLHTLYNILVAILFHIRFLLKNPLCSGLSWD